MPNLDKILNGLTTQRMDPMPVRCSRCGQILTDPESIKRGIGPVCAERDAEEGINTNEDEGEDNDPS